MGVDLGWLKNMEYDTVKKIHAIFLKVGLLFIISVRRDDTNNSFFEGEKNIFFGSRTYVLT